MSDYHHESNQFITVGGGVRTGDASSPSACAHRAGFWTVTTFLVLYPFWRSPVPPSCHLGFWARRNKKGGVSCVWVRRDARRRRRRRPSPSPRSHPLPAWATRTGSAAPRARVPPSGTGLRLMLMPEVFTCTVAETAQGRRLRRLTRPTARARC